MLRLAAAAAGVNFIRTLHKSIYVNATEITQYDAHYPSTLALAESLAALGHRTFRGERSYQLRLISKGTFICLAIRLKKKVAKLIDMRAINTRESE